MIRNKFAVPYGEMARDGLTKTVDWIKFSQEREATEKARNKNKADKTGGKKNKKNKKTEGETDWATSKEALSGLRVKDLKDILRKKGLKVSGRKAELIERLLKEGKK